MNNRQPIFRTFCFIFNLKKCIVLSELRCCEIMCFYFLLIALKVSVYPNTCFNIMFFSEHCVLNYLQYGILHDNVMCTQ